MIHGFGKVYKFLNPMLNSFSSEYFEESLGKDGESADWAGLLGAIGDFCCWWQCINDDIDNDCDEDDDGLLAYSHHEEDDNDKKDEDHG